MFLTMYLKHLKKRKKFSWYFYSFKIKVFFFFESKKYIYSKCLLLRFCFLTKLRTRSKEKHYFEKESKTSTERSIFCSAFPTFRYSFLLIRIPTKCQQKKKKFFSPKIVFFLTLFNTQFLRFVLSLPYKLINKTVWYWFYLFRNEFCTNCICLDYFTFSSW